MIEATIYTHKLDTSTISDPQDLLACYASERATCENLLTLGYTHSNGLSLNGRINQLSERIEHLAKVVRGRRHG